MAADSFIHIDEPAGTARASARRPRAWGLDGADLLTLALAGLLCVSVLPSAWLVSWAPKSALLAVAIGPGLVALALMVRDRDRAAMAAAAFVSWAFVSGVVSPSPRASILGDYGVDRSALYIGAFVGSWALGRRLSMRGTSVLPTVLTAGLMVSGLLGLLQVAAEVSGGLASPVSGRASGATDSPVYFGPLMAGAATLVMVGLVERRRWFLSLPLLAFFVMCVNLSGTRVALAALALGLLVAVSRMTGLQVVLVISTVLLGLGASSLVPEATGAGQRLSAGVVDGAEAAGVTPRVEAWKAAGQAILDRPIAGYGPGQFRLATTSRLSAEFARAEGPDRVFFDGHNLPIEYLTTTGLVGLILLGAWGISMGRSARGLLALFALVVGVTWLLEPASQSTAPLVFLALGAADTRSDMLRQERLPPWAHTVACVLAAIGVLAAGSLLLGDRAIRQLNDSRDIAHLATAERFLPKYPVLSDLRTQILLDRVASDDPSTIEDVLRSAERTIDLDETRWTYWVRLGEVQGTFDTLETAKISFRKALERYPWSERAWRGLAIAAVLDVDGAGLAEANGKLCEIRSIYCDAYTLDEDDGP